MMIFISSLRDLIRVLVFFLPIFHPHGTIFYFYEYNFLSRRDNILVKTMLNEQILSAVGTKQLSNIVKNIFLIELYTEFH